MQNIGYDSIKFVIPKFAFYKFLKKYDLYTKLRKTNRNKVIEKFTKEKFKSIKTKDKYYEFKVRYINIKPRNKSLSNTIIVIENSKDTHEVARKNKKKKDFYVEVQFNGLFQPSKSVVGDVYKILSKMVKRFKAYSFDIACDFCDENTSVRKYESILYKISSEKEFNGEMIFYKKSLYINRVHSKFFNLDRILIYDKYEKQTSYHKEKIKEEFKGWKRLELTFKLNDKFLKYIQHKHIHDALDFIYDFIQLLDKTDNFTKEMLLVKQTKYLINPRWVSDLKPYVLKDVA
ncbi:hypothetical protein FVD15_03490 [Campylobacter volucris]|uniref:Replication initiation protein n=1 Tax=Campylobacter volucris TaxID=1031542 RepID=A0AAE5YGK0_9BACT|nr:hypothetical protein [Campylobacter volucris]AJC94129.1 hypothetical protein CVOL_0822 [Campylobacter volucris LMG 24379]KAB0580287.1 hypothetical protein F7P61_01385 [Campylobacter volucris]QBL13499.1 hypothetical protein A9460_03800 [Campylobacter volucris]QEL08344.1 hypothetical protein CVOLT_0828 [Campylobacter volucris]TXK70536.1 hypothetical protein FVD15_03490 [Campylobacter volucris]